MPLFSYFPNHSLFKESGAPGLVFFKTSITMATEKQIVTEDGSDIGASGLKKRMKQKGVAHDLHWEILDNASIQAEEGWDAETHDYWTSKTCKKYVKMYHIDKLWPRSCHESHTKSFTCRPWMCNNDHFIYRAEEVWRALFGNRPKSKGSFNYSLLSMVYSEVVLNRKVDWTTFPTTTQYPLTIGRDQKHIPDLYNHESALTKAILEELKKKPRQTITVDTMPKVQRSVEEIAVELKCEKTLDDVVDNILSTTNPNDTLDERTIEGPVQSDIPGLAPVGDEDNDNAEPRGKKIDTDTTDVPKVQTLEDKIPLTTDAGPSTSTHRTLEPNPNDPILSKNILSGIEEILRNMPDDEKLKRLLETSVKWTELCVQKNGFEFRDEERSDLDQAAHVREVMIRSRDLMDGAEILFEMAPSLLDMAHAFANIAPSVLQGAIGVHKLSACIMPMFEDMIELLKTVTKLEDEAYEKDRLISELKRTSDMYKQLHKNKEIVIEVLQKRLTRAKGEEDVEVMEGSDKSSDDLSLSKFVVKTREIAAPCESSKPAVPSFVELAVEVGSSQVRPEVQGKGKAIVECDEEMESLSKKLEVANKERDEARAELEALRRTLTTVDSTPSHENTMPWLGWVHRLQDREIMVSKAQHDLKKFGAESQESCEFVDASLMRFNRFIGLRGHEPTKVTIWGDLAEMMDRTNHHEKGENNGIDWALEVEEGWMPYNTFSSNFEESARRVIHTCDPAPAFLNDKCSLCQEHFGPEGAYTLGQCGHNFHITCISASSMRQSVCPMCRSPISTRFYEVMGIRDVMPPGHEFNRWNLPLDQLPKKSQNFRDWGKPLIWNSEFSCHQLYEEYGIECDQFFWMTRDYEVEIRARVIEDGEQRELFCRNFGGHWSTEHKRFFRFPPKRVEKGEDGSWHEVEDGIEMGEEYKKYNRTLIGRALVLTKLEEATKLRCSTEEKSFEDVECSY